MSWKQDRGRRQRDFHGRDHRSHYFKKRPDTEEADDVAGIVGHDAVTDAVLRDFEQYQKELDSRYDKHERLVKRGRDVTIESKRIIFLLHRIMREEQKEGILEEADRRLGDLRSSGLRPIAEELAMDDPYLFLRAYSAGLQEFIEALSYCHYLKTNVLISYGEVQSLFVFEQNAVSNRSNETSKEEGKVTLHLPQSEYVLGIADLTGELMRKCINSIGAGNVNAPFELRLFLREILEGFSRIGNCGPREVSSKLNVLRQSVDKVENACYAIQVRRKEFPDYKLSDVLFLNQGSHEPRETEHEMVAETF